MSVSTPAEARRAVQEGADYVGIGAVWPTGSKDVTAKVKLAPEGVGAVLEELAGTGVGSVAIGMFIPLFTVFERSYLDSRFVAD